MEPIYVFIGLMFVHWVADFVLQSDWMAKNKSKGFKPLALHVLTYSTTLFIAAAAYSWIGADAIVGLTKAPLMTWVIVNGALHYVTDYYTSRLNSWLYPRSQHYFFVSIGFDQFIHITTLTLSLAWLTNIL